MISVDEISRITDKRNRIKKETYVKLYEQVSRKIRRAVDVGNKGVIVEIPSFLIGYATYDRLKATAYIKRQLELAGFNVVVSGNYILTIRWKVKKGVKCAEETYNNMNEDFPTLINLKKAANRYRRNAQNS
ncbi:MAG: hypothetical protein CL881_09360 [Dehalococcoidia bacterium]|jgi:hypothetical protein|nr:hypothetical protein [Dehalococcoidia bacterium]|tara:strand:- start:6435 stop:6827 length:393 start_codon:yes stop_codon:yes gene_type:complete